MGSLSDSPTAAGAFRNEEPVVTSTPSPEGQAFSGTKPRLWQSEFQDDIRVNRYRLEIMLRDFEESSNRVTLDVIWPWAATGMGSLTALATGDFHRLVGIPARGWEALFVFSIMFSISRALAAAWKMRAYRLNEKPTCASAITELMKEMRETTRPAE